MEGKVHSHVCQITRRERIIRLTRESQTILSTYPLPLVDRFCVGCCDCCSGCLLYSTQMTPTLTVLKRERASRWVLPFVVCPLTERISSPIIRCHCYQREDYSCRSDACGWCLNRCETGKGDKHGKMDKGGIWNEWITNNILWMNVWCWIGNDLSLM